MGSGERQEPDQVQPAPADRARQHHRYSHLCLQHSQFQYYPLPSPQKQRLNHMPIPSGGFFFS